MDEGFDMLLFPIQQVMSVDIQVSRMWCAIEWKATGGGKGRFTLSFYMGSDR